MFVYFLSLIILISGCATNTYKPLIPRQDQITKREVLATDFAYNATTGEISYTLPEGANIRIRMGLNQKGPLLRTLLDWEPREAGKHVEKWDFKDETGSVDFSDYKNIAVYLACIAQDQSKPFTIPSTVKGYHKSPRLEITFPQNSNSSIDGQPILNGVVPVRVTLNPEDHKWLIETRFELVAFVDGIFLAEDEEGNVPYNFTFNTKGLSEGTHLITVNVAGFQGEVGTKNVYVNIKNKNN